MREPDFEGWTLWNCAGEEAWKQNKGGRVWRNGRDFLYVSVSAFLVFLVARKICGEFLKTTKKSYEPMNHLAQYVLLIQNIPSQDTFQKTVDRHWSLRKRWYVGCYIKAVKDQADCGTREGLGGRGRCASSVIRSLIFTWTVTTLMLNLTVPAARFMEREKWWNSRRVDWLP